MKLEAVDRNNPPSYCVATVVKLLGHRVCIRYDGYGNDDSNDFWCNFQAEELHPIRSEEHTSELQSRQYLVCRLLLEKKKT